MGFNVNVESIRAAFEDPEISVRPFPDVCRKYGVYLDDITQLLTFAEDGRAFCARRKRDLDEAEADLEEYESVCVELDYAINDIARRRKIEMDRKAHLQESTGEFTLAHDVPYSGGRDSRLGACVVQSWGLDRGRFWRPGGRESESGERIILMAWK